MGEVFAGRYELLEPIGMGGMGTVWTVHDRQDGQLKAAKILRQSDAASLLRFVREQSLRITHPHVVTPQSWAGMDDRVLFTMPLVAGGSVADLLRAGGPRLPLPWVAALLEQLLDALAAVHAAGVVHRDVKPANLLLEPTHAAEPYLRLTDFGVAVPLDEPRMTRGVVAIGSPGYMAPEQWEGADPDPAQDLYAVGRVGIELLTGTRPERGADDGAGAVDESSLPEPREAARALLSLLRRCVANDPARRPASASGLRDEIAALGLRQLTVAGAAPIVEPRLPMGAPAPTRSVGPGGATAAMTAPLNGPLTAPLPGRAGVSTRVETGYAPAPGASGAARRSVVPAILVMLLGVIAVAVGVGLLLTA